MPKKNSSFGKLFDFNGDGKTDLGELFIAYNILRERSKDATRDDDDFSAGADLDFDSDYERDTSWRDSCEDGSDYDVSPEDFETEEEYEEALHEAKFAWRDSCEDGSDYAHVSENSCVEEKHIESPVPSVPDEPSKIDEPVLKIAFSLILTPDNPPAEEPRESDYPNRRQYNAACALVSNSLYLGQDSAAYKRRLKERCRFIIEKASTIPAANYLTHKGEFLYAQAIRDNFTLPVSLPEEDEAGELSFRQIICKIAKRDTSLALTVWNWSLEQFLPYEQYAHSAVAELTSYVIGALHDFPDGFKAELVRFMDRNPSFRQEIAKGAPEESYEWASLIAVAIREGLLVCAEALFTAYLEQTHGQWKYINNFTDDMISCCQNYEEIETMEFFRDKLFPLVRAVPVGMVQDEIKEWENDISVYIDKTEKESDKYAYSRRYSWRKEAPDGGTYGLDPLDYETEQQYLDALYDCKYGWRRRYKGRDTLGLNAEDFECWEEFREALDVRRSEKRQRERKEREEKRHRENEALLTSQEAAADSTVYTLCGVAFSPASHPYTYRTDDTSLRIGDTVLVPLRDREAEGVVVFVGQYLRTTAPFPIEKLKTVIRKLKSGDSHPAG